MDRARVRPPRTRWNFETAYTQKGGIIVGTGSGTYAEQAPGSSGQYLEYDTAQPGLRHLPQYSHFRRY